MPVEVSAKPIEILMVEDSPSDALIAKEALEYSKVLNKLHIIENGEDAMLFLRQQGKYSDAPRPGLILLDLNIPRKDGQEVLKEIKEDKNLRTIPVVILSTSKSEEDVLRSYGHHANCYITKPVEFSKFVEVVHSIREFWFSVVTLPAESDE